MYRLKIVRLLTICETHIRFDRISEERISILDKVGFAGGE